MEHMMEVTSTQTLGDLSVIVTADYDAGEPAGREGSSWDGPGIPESVVVDFVTINDVQIDRHEFSDRTLRRWEHNILIENT
jgi:hypothetical protein